MPGCVHLCPATDCVLLSPWCTYSAAVMFKLDSEGKCETCSNVATEEQIISCNNCQIHFHAVCNSEAGNGEHYIARKSHLGLHKQASTKPNFIWKCDICLTQAEANQAGSLKDVISSLVDRLNLLESKLSNEIKTQVSEAFTLLTASQTEEFDKLTASIANKPSVPVKSNPTVWDNLSKVEEMKSSLMVKPDQHGIPIDKNKLKKIVMDNGVPVNKIVVSQSGDTFINMPSEKVRDKLHPLLGSDNEVVFLKKKLPSVKLLGITEKLTSDQIKTGLCNQNEAIGNLVNAG